VSVNAVLDESVRGDLITSEESGRPPGVVRRLLLNRSAQIGTTLVVTVCLAALIGPLLYRADPLQPDILHALARPSAQHPFGTDALGRDLLARIFYGIRTSLLIAASAVAISGVIGTAIGLVVGYVQGYIDPLMMRIVDVFLAFPTLLLALVVIAILGTGTVSLIIALSVTQTWQYVRVVRAAVLGIKHQDYVASARAIGCSHLRVMVRHILVNVFPTVIVLATIGVAFAILTAAALSYLGLGAQPPTPELGAMLADGQTYIQIAWWLTVLPGLAILILTLGVNMLGDGLRDALDPRLRT
jgi:peptide/nickel transport system permease protein